MAENIIDSISRILGGNPSARRVADDLQLTSELILLVRMMFADGTLKDVEMAVFKKMCKEVFGLDETDIPGILEYLKDFGYETTAWDAASMFKDHSLERKKTLLLHLLKIAKSDDHIDTSEVALIQKIAGILELSPEEISQSEN